MRVIVTDCRYKMSLGPVRSLHRAGYRVLCGEAVQIPKKLWLGSRSRACDGTVTFARGDTLAQRIAAEAAPGDVILPVGRDSVRALAEHPELQTRGRWLVSDPEVLALADDKIAVWRLAKELGLPVPLSTVLRRGEPAPQNFPVPCILKYPDGEALGLHAPERYRLVRDHQALETARTIMEKRGDSLLLQEYLSGPDLGVALVMDRESRPVDFLCYESRLEYPLEGGPTCLCTTAFRRDLVEMACRILRAMKFRGIAMLDFKGGAHGPCLLEINPRVWGSAALVWRSGGGLFASYVKAALGEAEPLDLAHCGPNYRLGVRMKFQPQCYAAVAAELRRGQILQAGGHMAACLLGAGDGLMSFRDPGPFLRYVKNLLSEKKKG